MLNEFVNMHRILEVGITLPGYLCVDLIVDDEVGLLNLVAESDYYVLRINWWELAPIATGSVLGMGGPPDPRNSKEMFFSEVVHLGREFNEKSTPEDYLSFIESVRSSYPGVPLYPSFDIVRKNKM